MSRWTSSALAQAALLLGAIPSAHAASGTAGPSTQLPLSTSVNLAFSIAIGKFIFFRVGDGAWPTPGGSTSTVSFALSPSIPAVPMAPTTDNNRSVNWSGTAPGFSVTPSGNVLPVEIRSNAGQVTLRATATATTPLASGSNTIALSEITIASSDSDLPAPLISNTGTGAGVNVVPTAFAGMVTQRTANWTFSYANLSARPAGTYAGQVTFTASSP